MDTGLLWLFGAAAVGFALGWLMRTRQSSTNAEGENSVLAYKLRERDEELAAARAENTVHLSTLDTLRNEIATLRKKLEAYEHGDGKPTRAKTSGPRTAAQKTTAQARRRSRARTRKA